MNRDRHREREKERECERVNRKIKIGFNGLRPFKSYKYVSVCVSVCAGQPILGYAKDNCGHPSWHSVNMPCYIYITHTKYIPALFAASAS